MYHIFCQLSSQNYKKCVFKPKVQVLDNWGYCNGTCDGSSVYEGCYNDTSGKKLTVEQCDYKDANEDADLNPWTEYKGQIIIIP